MSLLGKLKIQNFDAWTHHAYGWPNIIAYLSKFSEKHQHKTSVLFEPAIEYTFTQNRDACKIQLANYKKYPWVGVAHHHPNDHRLDCRLSEIVKNEKNKKAFSNCKGIFVLTDIQKTEYKKTKEISNIPISRLFHPVKASKLKFKKECLRKSFEESEFPQNSIVSIGDHCRKFGKFSVMKTNKIKSVCFFQKEHWRGPDQCEYRDRLLKISNVKRYDTYFDNHTYDKILRNNIQFAELENPTASNYILECIERNVPIYVSKTDSILEYLGEFYPFYMKDNINEIENDLNNNDLILNTFEYLSNHPFKEKFKLKYFLNSIVKSDVYQLL